MFKFLLKKQAAVVLAFIVLLGSSLYFGHTSDASTLTLHPYLGNTHAHSKFSGDAVVNNDYPNTYEDIYDRAKSANNYDFYSVTDHTTGIGTINQWANAATVADQRTDSTFLGIRGFEFTLNTDLRGKGKGHINIFGSSSLPPNVYAGDYDLTDFYAWLKNSDAVAASFNHPGPVWGNFNNFGYRDAALNDKITMMEVINGTDPYYTYRAQYVSALDMGWKLGAVAGHDNHTSELIAGAQPRTGVLATALTKTAVLDAMKNHRTWASLDPNLKLNKYILNNGTDSVDIGSTISGSNHYTLTINLSDPNTGAAGDKITKINIIKNGGAVAATLTPNSYSTGDLTASITNDSTSTYFYLEVYTADDANAPTLYSAPIFIGSTSGGGGGGGGGGTNLIGDPGFENQSSSSVSSPWTLLNNGGIDRNLGFAHSGTNNGWVRSTSGWNAIKQQVSVEPNASYTLKVWLRSSPNMNNGYFGARGVNSGPIINEIHLTSAMGSYTQKTVTFDSGNRTSLDIYAGIWADGDTWMRMDDFTLVKN